MKTTKPKNPWYFSHRHKEGWTIASQSYPTLDKAIKGVKEVFGKSLGSEDLSLLKDGVTLSLYDGAEKISVRNKTPGYYRKLRMKSYGR